MAKNDENRPARREGTQLVKADEKQLVEKIRADIGERVVSGFAKSGKLSAKLSIDNDIRITQDMSPETANAIVQSSWNKYAVPAQQRTARSVEQTKRLKIAGLVAVVFAGFISIRPEAGWPIAAVAGALEISILSGDIFNREKRKKRSHARRSNSTH